MMKSRLLASFLLGFLFVIDSLGDSSARIFQGQEGNKNELEVTRITAMFAQEESSDGTRATHMRKLGQGGSKLMAHKEPSTVFKNEKEAQGRTSKISGEKDDGLKNSMESLPEQMNDQKEHMTMLEPKASKFTSLVIPRSSLSDRNPKFYCSQYSNAEVAVEGRLGSPSRPAQRQISEGHPHSQGTTQKDETKNLNKAAKEIVNLMHKDYKGIGNSKPPINNHEPRN